MKDFNMRDQFACHALQALLVECDPFAPFENIAQKSYEMADAMMVARDEKPDERMLSYFWSNNVSTVRRRRTV